jgi:hypothetical protein
MPNAGTLTNQPTAATSGTTTVMTSAPTAADTNCNTIGAVTITSASAATFGCATANSGYWCSSVTASTACVT